MIPSNLIAYEDAILLGTITATVTDSGIALSCRVRQSRGGDFGTSASRLLMQIAGGVDPAAEDDVSGIAADVFDQMLTQGSQGETGRVRFVHARAMGEPTLPARALLRAVARRVAIRWPYKPGGIGVG